MMQIDLQCTFLVGSLMAYLSRKKLIVASPEWIARTRNVVLAFGGIIFAPVWLYITLRWTPWETMYIWDLSTVPFWFVALFLPFLSITALIGWRITQKLIRSKKMLLSFLINGAVLASVIVVVALGWEQAGFVGTLEEFRAGQRGNLFQSDLIAMLAVTSLWVFLPAGGLIITWLRSPAEPNQFSKMVVKKDPEKE